MDKIAVIGHPSSVWGFKRLGWDVFEVEEKIPPGIISFLKKGDYAIIFITEDIAAEIKEKLEEVHYEALPSIVTLPTLKENRFLGKQELKEIIRKAIGAEI
jgi:V/A-type H+-transporting ATPase subunit F